MSFKLPEQVENALFALHNAGFSAYIVGGSVRDLIMGLNPADYDISTSASPLQTKAVFAGKKLIPTGIKHGTITVISDGMPIEITTFRTENGYSDSRHPDSVSFAESYRQDALRRDFTINAMAYSGEEGIIDYFNGRNDIENKLIRCVGNPDDRFKEDALRIMRAVRFAAVYGFDIEKETAAAARRNKERLLQISAERSAAELKKLLCGKYAEKAVNEYSDILGVLIPEILPMRGFLQHNPHHIYDVMRHTAAVVQNTPPQADIRLAALFHDAGKPETFSLDENAVGHFYGHSKVSAEIAGRALKRLKFDNETIKNAVTLVEKHDMQIDSSEKAVKRALNKLGPEMYFKLISLKRADNKAQSPEYLERQNEYDRAEQTARRILKERDCFSLKELAVNGGDIIGAGVERGRQVGEALEFLLNAVIEGKTENEKDGLIDFLKNCYMR